MRKISVAIVGSGISGLSCGWLLSKNCDVTIFEKNNYIGGHSNTVSINPKNCKDILSVDTGFIVFNEFINFWAVSTIPNTRSNDDSIIFF